MTCIVIACVDDALASDIPDGMTMARFIYYGPFVSADTAQHYAAVVGGTVTELVTPLGEPDFPDWLAA